MRCPTDPPDATGPEPAPRRILLVRLSHLGDVVHALPLYHALRAEHPGARLAWAVQGEFAELVRGLPGIERVVLFDRRGGLGAWPRLRAELLDFGAELAVDVQGNTKSALVTLASGAGRRVGWHPRDWTERFGAHVLTDCAPPLARAGAHAVERVLHLARHVAPRGLARVPARWCEPDAERREAARLRLEELLPTGRGGALALVLVARPDDVRSWPAAHYVELARELAARGARALYVSGPAEAELGRALERELAPFPGIAHLAGQRGLAELAALLTAAAERGARALACDSGPLHLAAACGLPVVALCGPQDARRTGPWPAEGGPHIALAASPPPPCAPCLARRCAHPRGPVCMSRIPPAEAARALCARAPEVDAA